MAIGGFCDEGAVLLTDSLYTLRTPTGTRALLYASPRFELLPGCVGVACLSANFRTGWAPSEASGLSSPTLEQGADGLLSDLAANGLSLNDYVTSDGQSHFPRGELVAAGRSADGLIRIAMRSTYRESVDPEPGHLVCAGAASSFQLIADGVAPASTPFTLQQLTAIALYVARAMVAITYANEPAPDLHGLVDVLIGRGIPFWNHLPPFSPSFHVATVTEAGVMLQRYAE